MKKKIVNRNKMRIMKKNLISKKAGISYLEIAILIISSFAFAYLVAPENEINKTDNNKEFVGLSALLENAVNYFVNQIQKPIIVIVSAETITQTVCCEKTNYGAWCQNAPSNQCDVSGDLKTSPTSCDATSFCRQGCCYDSNEGTCMENTPQRVCNMNNGTWADSGRCEIPQCNLGCCVLGVQAAFVTLTRCKRLSAFYGLQTDFRNNINNELECIGVAQSQDMGACVYELDYSTSCKFTTRGNCGSKNIGAVNGTLTGNFTFYKDYLCSAEELHTNCGPTKNTVCVPGKDEVYFLDSCGNPANIYDSSKINDKSYWKKIIPKADSCGFGNTNGNANSPSCGNCDYFLGSYCKSSKKASYGNNICSDLSCKNTYNGKDYRNGESWCVNDDKIGSVGSRYFRHICANGEEVLEACDDFRATTCIEDKISTGSGVFSQAACRANMWKDCTQQTEKDDCINSDKRDCKWIKVVGSGLNSATGSAASSVSLPSVTGTTTTPSVTGKVITGDATKDSSDNQEKTWVCVPANTPGLKFYEGGDAQGICSQANTQCVVVLEKGLIGSEKCVANCTCLDKSWGEERNKLCVSLGDCGSKTNYLGVSGYDKGYKVNVTKVDVVSKILLPLLKFSGYVLFGNVESVRAPTDAMSLAEQGYYGGGTGKVNAPSSVPLGNKGPGDIIPPTPTTKTFILDSKATGLTNYYSGRIIQLEGQQIAGAQTFIYNGANYAFVNDKFYLKDGNQFKIVTDDTSLRSSLLKEGASTGQTAAPTGLQAFFANAIVATASYALIVGTVTSLIAGFIFPANSNANEAGFWAGIAGGAATNIAHITWTGQNFLGGQAYMGMGTSPINPATASFNPTNAFWGSAAIGIGVAVVVFALLYKEQNQKIITFECYPWEAPIGGNDCQKCNKDDFKPCTEYRCKSLGQACEIIPENAGTKENMCVWKNRNDVKSPGISPNEDVLLKGYKYTDVRIRPPGDGSEPGRFRIEQESAKCVKAFTPLSFGITTVGPDGKEEPAQCKIDYNHTAKFDDMAFYFGNSNLYLYNHTQVMSLPAPANIKSEGPTLQNDGEYTLYVRCRDANGNENVDEFAIKFCVDKGPDITPPEITTTSIINGMPVQFNLNETKLDVYVNEPSTCKWGRTDASYDNMNNEMSCQTSIVEMNNNLLYKCSTTLNGLQNSKDNVYYFRCKDQPFAPENDRNVNQESYVFTLKGTQALNILSSSPDNETIRGFSTVVPVNLKIETANGYNQGDAICYYSATNLEKDYIAFLTTGTNKHEQRQDLPAGSYKYYFKCIDLGGNAAYDNVIFKVEVDQQPPIVVRAYNEAGVSSVCGNLGCLKVVTNEKSSCAFSTKDCNFAVEDGTQMPYANDTAHYAEWKTDITYYIRCMDEAGNKPNSNSCSAVVKAYNQN